MHEEELKLERERSKELVKEAIEDERKRTEELIKDVLKEERERSEGVLERTIDKMMQNAHIKFEEQLKVHVPEDLQITLFIWRKDFSKLQ